MKKFSPKNIAWYLGDKVIVPTTSLLGVGAARAVDDKSVLEGIVQTVKFPYELLISKGFLPETVRTLVDLTDNVVQHPYETLGCIAGGYLLGKIASMYSEQRRLKKRYTPKEQKE